MDRMERWQRIVNIIDLIAGEGDRGVGVGEIAGRLDLPRATVYRTLNGLADSGILSRLPGGGFSLGLKALEWAGRFLAHARFVQPLQEAVNQVTQALGLFSYAAWMQDDAILCVAIAQPRRLYPVYVRLGARLPLRASAAAKVLLAGLPEGTARRLLAEEALPGWEPTPFTLSVEGAFAELVDIRQKGWAVCMEELEVGNSALAVALGPSASLAVVGTTTVVGARQEEILGVLRDVAAAWRVPLDLYARAGGV